MKLLLLLAALLIQDPDGPPQPEWCCAGICRNDMICSGPAFNCPAPCEYTYLGCLNTCHPEFTLAEPWRYPEPNRSEDRWPWELCRGR